MPGRKFGTDGRYGFNGKERDKDLHSLTAYDYGFRIYNPAIGKFLSVDPLTSSFPMLTPYQFASNMPIVAIDLDGLESKPVVVYESVNVDNIADQEEINWKQPLHYAELVKFVVSQLKIPKPGPIITPAYSYPTSTNDIDYTGLLSGQDRAFTIKQTVWKSLSVIARKVEPGLDFKTAAYGITPTSGPGKSIWYYDYNYPALLRKEIGTDAYVVALTALDDAIKTGSTVLEKAEDIWGDEAFFTDNSKILGAKSAFEFYDAANAICSGNYDDYLCEKTNSVMKEVARLLIEKSVDGTWLGGTLGVTGSFASKAAGMTVGFMFMPLSTGPGGSLPPPPPSYQEKLAKGREQLIAQVNAALLFYFRTGNHVTPIKLMKTPIIDNIDNGIDPYEDILNHD